MDPVFPSHLEKYKYVYNVSLSFCTCNKSSFTYLIICCWGKGKVIIKSIAAGSTYLHFQSSNCMKNSHRGI